MDTINKLCCYTPGSEAYCGKIQVKYMIYAAFILMTITQLYITIWYLTYQVWWWFFALVSCIAALCLFGFAIWKQTVFILKGIMVYQALFSLVFFAASIWLLVLLCHPYYNSYNFTLCFNVVKNTASHCAAQVRIAAAVYFPIYFIAGIINLYCLAVIYNFMECLRKPALPNYNPQFSPPLSRPQHSPVAHNDYLPTD